jgi:ubiquinol-cytochrome c reductase cytochrome b subunit
LVKKWTDWLEARTGYRAILHEALDEHIPGGARWRYVFGSALTSTFLIQAVTGLFLMTSYSPSSSTAWGSVYYISHDLVGGWFLRGLHHFGAQAMVVLLVLHLLQVLVAGAYRAPREINWWFGMALLFLTLGFSLTGYLLPWDQKGYWATKVATNIAGNTPLVGSYIQRIVLGGPEYGNQTLTRFYGLHVGVLPTLLVLCLAAHVALFRKHGVTAPKRSKKPDGSFWPEQFFMDAVASAAVLGVIIVLVLREGGANLDAPADPASGDYPARPEWYFLSLFQLLKLPFFAGEREVIGTMVVPGAIVTVLLLLPLFDKVFPRGLAHFLACALVFGVVGGAAYFTLDAVRDDARNAQFQEARRKADRARDRALRLAAEGIPPDGAAYLLLRDPLHRGAAILEAKCLGCHAFGGHRTGKPVLSAADLKGYGTRDWARRLLENPDTPEFFGVLRKCDASLAGMRTWKRGSKATARELDHLADFLAAMAAAPIDTPPAVWLEAHGKDPGAALFETHCATCHGLGEAGAEGPNVYGWGSLSYFRRMVRDPGADDLYGFVPKSCRMPSFADELTDDDLEALHRYLRADYVDAPAAGR